ncbi:MAG: nicotinamide-nucleotide adenylyltransferase [Candidatus Hodarchaeota archaeon]
MENEILACIRDKDIKFLHSGQISKYIFPLERVQAHREKISHLIIRLFMVAILPKNQILYLVQRRGKKKKSFPNFFTDSASGHVIYKKNLNLRDIKEDAKRELKEEFGIAPKAIKKMNFYDLKAEENEKTTEIAYTFVGLVNHDILLNPNPEELDINDSRFYTKSELVNILQNEKNIDYSKEIWKELLNTDLITYFKKIKTTTKKGNNNNGIGLFIGRFQPLHHGHIYIIKNILKSYEQIKIGIGSSQLSNKFNDPFTSDERKLFIEAALKKRMISPKKYTIYKIPDIFNAKLWVNHVVSIIGNFGILFSNSDWVRTLFQDAGYNVAKKITIFKKKYNGTNIRNLIKNDNDKWKMLVPKEVRVLMDKFDGINRIKILSK